MARSSPIGRRRKARVGAPLPTDPERSQPKHKPLSVNALFKAAGGAGLVVFERGIRSCANQPRYNKKNERTYLCYKSFIESVGHEPLPLTAFKLNLFSAYKSHEWDNAVSCPQWRSQVVSHVTFWTDEAPNFTSDDRRRMAEFDKACGVVYGSYSEQTRGISGRDLREIHAALQPSPEKDLAQWVTWVFCVVAYFGLLRPNEFTKGSGVRVRDVQFLALRGPTPAGMSLSLPNTKRMALKGSSDEEMAFIPCGDSAGDVLDPCELVRRYIELFGLDDDDLLDRPLFALYREDTQGRRGALTSEELSLDTFNRRFKALQLAAGRTEAQLRTARDFRSGRRTDLGMAGVPSEMVMLMGRWKTLEACTGYLRGSAELLRVVKRHFKEDD